MVASNKRCRFIHQRNSRMRIVHLFSIISLAFLPLASASIPDSFGTKVSCVHQDSCEPKDEKESSELDQRALFDKTRRGVVSIKVSVVLDRATYNKLWYGTGFVVDKEQGLIVTNAHVAGELTVCSYEVKFGNGKKVEAKLMYIDPCYDFAILSVSPKDIPQYVVPLKISNDDISINTEIYSMGNSANNEFSTYKGYVFDTESILWLKPIAEQSFQFSGLTVPGASGSPVLNTRGEVIGLLYGGKFVSGAALPISYVMPVIKALQSGKNFHRYFCGFMINYGSLQDFISVGNLPESALEEYEKAFPESNDKVLYVTRKLSAFAADKSGLEPGDIIWKVENELIGPQLRKIDELVQQKEGRPISLTIYRNSKRIELEVPTFELSNMSKMRLLSFAGTVFYETPPEYKICLGKSSTGVYVADCESGSAFSDLCAPDQNPDVVTAGAQIISIDGKDISTLDDVVDVIQNLFKKKVFNIKFVRLCGDSQISSVTTKHTPEFAEATLYTFDQSSKNWNVKSIKNPKQNG